MKLLLIHPNYHSGGAEIAGNWPPAWVAYLAGPLKAAGYDDITFIDAMTNNVEEDELRARIAELQPDIVGCTAITPSIYRAERVLEIAKEAAPDLHVQAGPVRSPPYRRHRARRGRGGVSRFRARGRGWSLVHGSQTYQGH